MKESEYRMAVEQLSFLLEARPQLITLVDPQHLDQQIELLRYRIAIYEHRHRCSLKLGVQTGRTATAVSLDLDGYMRLLEKVFS